MTLIAALLVWCGCTVSYYSSEHQIQLSKALNKSLAWAGMLCTNVCAVWLLSVYHSLIIASLFVIGFTMLSWVAIVLINGHPKLKHTPLLILFLLSTLILFRWIYVA